MADENMYSAPTPPFSAEHTPGTAGEPTVAFCQQCGRGLTAGAVRNVGSGIFCEPCAANSSAGSRPYAPGGTANGYTRVHAPVVDPVSTPPPPVPGQPNPALAAFLGLIPGVGAMYNGQYAKGVVHLVIFVILTSLADNLNWVLWWFVWGWIFYQAFEAYHTAQARRDGDPLPDPFGWNDLGERLGLSRTSPPVSAPGRTTSRPAPSWSDTPATSNPGPAPSATASAAAFTTEPVPTASTSTFTASVSAGHIPSTAVPFASPLPGSYQQSPSTPFERQYGPTYTGVAAPPSGTVSSSPSLTQRFPAGAVWLIGLGFLFLIGNLAPEWRLQARWLVPVLLAVLAVWIGGRRIETALRYKDRADSAVLGSLAENLVGAAILLTLAILLALQNAYVVPLRHSWPAVLIVWGALLLLGRATPPGSGSADASAGAPEFPSSESSTPR